MHTAAAPGCTRPKPCRHHRSGCCPSRPQLHIRLVVARASADVLATHSIPGVGEVTIQPLQPDDVQGAGVLLTRAFAGTAEAVKLDEALQYMRERVQSAAAASGLALVARLVPDADAAASLPLPPGKSSRLVATTNLSFDASSREAFASLAPPQDEWYLANMAVDPRFRRRGIARAMLRACDAAAQRRGQPCIWLHVRQADEAAQQLYIRWGASEVGRDKPKLGLFGLGGGSFSSNSRPRILMRRQLEPGGAQEAVAAAAAPQQQEESVS